MARKVDSLGRIVLPAEMRHQFGINTGDALEISVEDNTIALRKIEQLCIFCRSNTDLSEFRGRLICGDCNKSLEHGDDQ